MTRRGRRQRGFTLLEVVVATALFALVMGLVYGGTSTAVRAYEAGEQRVATGARLRVVSAFLRRSLTGAFPMALISGRDWQLLFGGDGTRLHYVADLPGYVGSGGLHEIELLGRRSADHVELVLRRRPLVVDAGGVREGKFHEVVLLERISGLALRYYGAGNAEDPPRWVNEWPPGKQMPLLVELRVHDAGGDPWPPLVVRPQVDTVRYQGTSGPLPGAQAGEGEQPPAAPATRPPGPPSQVSQ